MLSDVQFEALAARYIDTIYAVAFSALKNRADAEDVTQDVLIQNGQGVRVILPC